MANIVGTNISITGVQLETVVELSRTVQSQLLTMSDGWGSEMTAQFIEAILSTALLGLYTSLAIIALWILCWKGFKTAPVVMLLVVFVMYACTAVYGATVILEAFQQMAEALSGITFSKSQMDQILEIYNSLDENPSETEGNGPQALGLFFSETLSWITEMRQCVGTVSLTTNVILGDAIVWWRAWVLWRDNRVVQSFCLFLMFATSATSITVTTQACGLHSTSQIRTVIMVDPSHQELEEPSMALGSLFIGDKWELAASILSLITNIAATSLIAYKAWQLNFVLASHYILGFTYVVEGCLISLIGIYPTLIIVLVALNKSHCDTNFTYGAKIDLHDPTARTALPNFRVPAMSGQTYSESSVSVEDIPSSESIPKHAGHGSTVYGDASFSRDMDEEKQEEVYHAI
ncbi:hypothetical protein C8Q74DRAFT_1216149 [Fomes fomentarius]|nr:hypothetical protein C8Q74DRAFT_1216149 [Fomes fomentarius]